MRTIIQNGTIVSDTAAFRADLLLEEAVLPQQKKLAVN